MDSLGARGFTILELMVVLTIVGVLAVFGLPEMRNLVVGNRMKTLSLDLYADLALARSEAVKRNVGNLSLVATGGSWQNGWSVCVDSNADNSCAGEVVLSVADAVDSSISLSGPAGNVVTYSRDGRLSSPSALFKITAGANNSKVPMRCVDVSVSGRPRTLVDTNHVDSDGCN
jgi:type IV fimbrial biogenesis protein FimT